MIDFARNGKFSPKIGFDETEWGYFWLDQKKCHSVSSHSTGILNLEKIKGLLLKAPCEITLIKIFATSASLLSSCFQTETL